MRCKYTKEFLEPIIKQSYSIREVIKKLGLIPAGGNYTSIKKYIKIFAISTNHFKGRGWNKGLTQNSNEKVATIARKNRLTCEKVLIENSLYNRKTALRIIKRNNLLKYQCDECGLIDIWKGKPITLVLDHKNGINDDHRLENLRWLCPNCNSQTNTFCGRNIKYARVAEPVDAQLLKSCTNRCEGSNPSLRTTN